MFKVQKIASCCKYDTNEDSYTILHLFNIYKGISRFSKHSISKTISFNGSRFKGLSLCKISCSVYSVVFPIFNHHKP